MINGGLINSGLINAGLSSSAPTSAGWSLSVIVDGVDVSGQLVDRAPVMIEAERNAARIAEFTLLLSGIVDPNDWTGKAVIIDYIDGVDSHRLFVGVIAEPTLDIVTATLRCTCSDDIQRVADDMTHAELLTLTGAYWSDDVFDIDASGWERLLDMLSTTPISVWLDTDGDLVCISKFNAAMADMIVTASDVLDESLRVELVQRSNLINRVDVTFRARFERLYHRVETLEWNWPLSFCETFEYGLKHLTKQVVLDAIDAAGWHVTVESYDPLWPTGIYNCSGGPVAFNNLSPDQLINGFTVEAAKRWQQSVTHEYMITVRAPDSIAAYGELKQALSGAADFSSAVTDWGNDENDYPTLPSGFSWDNAGNRYRDEIDGGRLTAALNALIGQAVQRINDSHASNRVLFDLPINPFVDLANTIQVTAAGIDAKGIVNRIRHVLELSTARAVTSVELAISSGQSGLDTLTQTWTTPTQPPQPTGPANTPITVPNHIGRSWDTVEFDETLWGWFVNRETPELIGGVPPDPVIFYATEQLIVEFPAVDDSKTQNRTDPVIAIIEIDVPHNLLTLTA